MSSRVLVQNALGNRLIDFLHCNLVSAIGLGAIAFCGSSLELLDGGLQLGLRGLVKPSGFAGCPFSGSKKGHPIGCPFSFGSA